MTVQIDKTDALILDLIQREFPLKSRPFDALAESLAIETADVLERIKRLKSDGVIRQISGIFDSGALGYKSSLVAFKVASDHLEFVAAEVSKNPGVSHCYSRDADYNLWFTITLPPKSDLHLEVANLLNLNGVLAQMLLPALNIFKIGVYLDMGIEKRLESRQHTSSPGGEGWGEGAFEGNREQRIESGEPIEAVQVLQVDLPLIEKPFYSLANQKGMLEGQLIAYAQDFLQQGVMRRYSAVLNHRRAGYTFNAMICWVIPFDVLEQVGHQFARNTSVSHCYQRPTYPDWPYSLYTMVHARSQIELNNVISDLAQASNNSEHLVLNTVAEFKKTRVLYFK